MISQPTRQQHARIAGLAFQVYIVAGLAETAIFSGAVGEGAAPVRLANVLQHATQLRLTAVLTIGTVLSSLVLAVALFVITHRCNVGLALIGLVSRVAEGVVGAVYALPALGLVSAARALEGESGGLEARSIVALLLDLRHDTMMLSAVCFAAGSSAFSFLLLQGRVVPPPLAWLGVVASVLLLLALPVQFVAGTRSMLGMLIWLPMLVFELVLAVWFLLKGVPPLDGGAGPP